MRRPFVRKTVSKVHDEEFPFSVQGLFPLGIAAVGAVVFLFGVAHPDEEAAPRVYWFPIPKVKALQC